METTPAERERFAAALTRIALLTGKTEKPDKVVLREYWIALQDFHIDTIEDVAERIRMHEHPLISIPPPGRWREIAEQMFELRPRVRVRPGDERCGTCDGTGWRIVFTGSGRAAVRCQHDGTPDEEPPRVHPRAVSMHDLVEGEIGPPAEAESELQKRRREWGNVILHCACCGAPYRQRVNRRCVCVPPPGTSIGRWIEKSHLKCPNPLDGAQGAGNVRCPNHCGCTPEQRGAERELFFPLPKPGQHVDAFLKEQGLRDADAPAPGSLEDEVGF